MIFHKGIGALRRSGHGGTNLPPSASIAARNSSLNCTVARAFFI
ncbi:hypothetical protein [Paroceanicella profunda]|nr:hypothetical protein [Paroceanicella profunda]